MASASDADLAKMVENYAALKEAQDTTSESIADLKTGMSNSMDEIAQTVADTVSEMDMSDEATESAKATIQGFIDGASSMMPRVQEAYAKIASAASTALAGSNERYNANHGIPGWERIPVARASSLCVIRRSPRRVDSKILIIAFCLLLPKF